MPPKYKKFEALTEAKEDGVSTDYYANDNPKCPHCGEVYDIHKNEAFYLYDPDRDFAKIECPACQMSFITQIDKSISFDTEASDELEEEDVPL